MSDKKKKDLNRAIGNALFSDTERAEMWLAEHWKKVLTGAIVILIAASAAFIIWKQMEAKKQAATDALKTAPTVEKLQAAIAEFGDNDAAPAARYRLATMLLMEKKYKDAIAQYQIIADDPKCNAALAENARLAAIKCTEFSGDLKKAAADYAIFGNDAQMSPAHRAAADYSAARLLLDLGDRAQADAILAKTRLIGNDQTLLYWNSQLDALALSVKNGDYNAPKKSEAKPAGKPAAAPKAAPKK